MNSTTCQLLRHFVNHKFLRFRQLLREKVKGKKISSITYTKSRETARIRGHLISCYSCANWIGVRLWVSKVEIGHPHEPVLWRDKWVPVKPITFNTFLMIWWWWRWWYQNHSRSVNPSSDQNIVFFFFFSTPVPESVKS